MKLHYILLLTFFALQSKDAKLVNIKKIIPDIVLDLKYATKDNFTKTKIYSSAKCFLLEPVAEALKKVQADLKTKGFQLKIWDCYRPLAAQKKMWKVVPDERYVANPSKGGRHTRGTAVDCTLLTLGGKEVTMPTEFDNFTEKAHSQYNKIPDEAKKNRDILQQTMVKYGFETIKTEWWHFDYKNWQDYKPLDIAFEKIK